MSAANFAGLLSAPVNSCYGLWQDVGRGEVLVGGCGGYMGWQHPLLVERLLFLLQLPPPCAVFRRIGRLSDREFSPSNRKADDQLFRTGGHPDAPAARPCTGLAHCPELFMGDRPATRIAYDMLSTINPDDHSRLVLVTIEEGMTADMHVRVFADACVLLLEGDAARVGKGVLHGLGQLLSK
ncbi:hypothetical protein EHS17_13980 [Rhodobacteraceae bacterium CH30]|nr:hypothetical protein EHS17_13980 [Rhodobacteraceae bacterium CH30]